MGYHRQDIGSIAELLGENPLSLSDSIYLV